MYVDMKFYHLINLTSIVRERERELKQILFPSFKFPRNYLYLCKDQTLYLILLGQAVKCLNIKVFKALSQTMVCGYTLNCLQKYQKIEPGNRVVHNSIPSWKEAEQEDPELSTETCLKQNKTKKK